jgi:hypothetical protein
MLKLRFRLLALSLVLAAAPASVGHGFAAPAGSVSHNWDCPYEEQARLAAAGYETMPVSTEGDPAEGSFFDPGRRAVFAP